MPTQVALSDHGASLIDSLARLATGRTEEFFREDLERNRVELAEELRDKRVLVIGGAGSIGSSTTALLSDFHPHSLHVIDQNENNLTELVRDLRSRPQGLMTPDFRALPIDFGSPVMRRFLATEGRYDLVLNFAALKHVRSEKDIYSLLQMLHTNIVKPWRLWEWLQDIGTPVTYFSVSTDKAANPVNLMGASKRVMEHVMFSDMGPMAAAAHVTTSRFANVAFSDGSLLAGFLKRFEKRQPLACPQETRRFFISLTEAGQICLLSAICGPNRHIVIPRLNREIDLRKLDEIAASFLQWKGFEPAIYEDEEQARSAVSADMNKKRYPLLLTRLDTMGEKPYEEFVGDGETSHDFGMSDLEAVSYLPLAQPAALPEFVRSIQSFVDRPQLQTDKTCLVEMMSALVPELRHIKRPSMLDDRM